MTLRGALARMDPWTPAEEAVLVEAYQRGGLAAARAALPDRSPSALFHRAARLGAKRRRRWTSREVEDLREFWAEGVSLETIASRLGRTRATIYVHAQALGLTSQVPPGFERLSAAATRTGYTTGQLARIMRWAGKRIRAVIARPGPRKTGHRYRMVDTIALEDALAAWHRTETAQAAARRLGISGDRLRARLARIGKPTAVREHRRITPEDLVAANQIARPRRMRALGAGAA